VKRVGKDKWDTTRVGEVMQQGVETLSVTPDDDVSAVLARVIRDRCGRLPVVDDGRVVGIITRRDILEALKVISDLE
jgi:CBS domain-containing protein